MTKYEKLWTQVPISIWTLLAVSIITIPAFLSLLNGQYFSMHDDQHVARLYLLDQGIRQGSLYPRWVDNLGFGYGYPLFNFYPPLIYYIGELFHLVGFSLIWSIKLVFITGFILAAWGSYLFSKKYVGRIPAFVAATLYTYFFYHAVNAYVRGALAEFFSMAILPFVFLSIKNLANERNLKNTLFFAGSFALIILNHPLIAVPALFYILFFFLFYFFSLKRDTQFTKFFIIAIVMGLGLSAFFWLPSMVEKQYTLVDNILTRELANYKLHFIYPTQLINSLWGYGGSIAGSQDGMTFQLGKIHLILAFLAITLSAFYLKDKKWYDRKNLYFFAGLTLFSVFMTLPLSRFIWDRLPFLWYLQFPWRFLTFVGLFLSLLASYFIFIIQNTPYFKKNLQSTTVIAVIIIVLTIGVYSRYFKPQLYRNVTDASMTSYQEIAWNVSRSSFEFVPKGIKTTRTDLNTTTLDIQKKEIPTVPYFIEGDGYVTDYTSQFSKKIFYIHALSDLRFRLNTYNFPGWTAHISPLDRDQTNVLTIQDNNDLRLITVDVPKGQYKLTFEFKNTPYRSLANGISLLSAVLFMYLFFRRRKSAGQLVQLNG